MGYPKNVLIMKVEDKQEDEPNCVTQFKLGLASFYALVSYSWPQITTNW
jgi:hypothetical protein